MLQLPMPSEKGCVRASEVSLGSVLVIGAHVRWAEGLYLIGKSFHFNDLLLAPVCLHPLEFQSNVEVKGSRKAKTSLTIKMDFAG